MTHQRYAKASSLREPFVKELRRLAAALRIRPAIERMCSERVDGEDWYELKATHERLVYKKCLRARTVAVHESDIEFIQSFDAGHPRAYNRVMAAILYRSGG